MSPFNFPVIDPSSRRSKYRQIADVVIEAVNDGRLHKGEALPSINEVSERLGLARDTVVKAYSLLKQLGVLESAHGKAFHITTNHVDTKLRVFVLFDAFTPYKETLYRAIRHYGGADVELDIFFHHFNVPLFCKLLNDAKGRYQRYVVMPFTNPEILECLRGFDDENLLLLDRRSGFQGCKCSALVQDHDVELEKVLGQAVDYIFRYSNFTLVFPEDKNHPLEIKDAFLRFCVKNKIKAHVVEHLCVDSPLINNAYFVIEDTDLVELAKAGKARGLQLGVDFGIISYNDTSMKEIAGNGISVVSVDFAEMGRKTALWLLGEKLHTYELEPSRFIARHSL
ncbi:MAG: GntR family transcriptional regulator [Verrucomicrobia bacterium]|nr:GntR family transcriptional regulator [Verrucomicrobiota bacterium]